MIQRYKMHFPEFPYYLSVFRYVENDTVKVDIESSIHVNKKITLGNSWSVEFVRVKPNRFHADVFSAVIKRYGLKKQPTKYE